MFTFSFIIFRYRHYLWQSKYMYQVRIRRCPAVIMPIGPPITSLGQKAQWTKRWKLSLKMAKAIDELLKSLVFKKHFGNSASGHILPGAVSRPSWYLRRCEEEKELAQFFVTVLQWVTPRQEVRYWILLNVFFLSRGTEKTVTNRWWEGFIKPYLAIHTAAPLSCQRATLVSLDTLICWNKPLKTMARKENQATFSIWMRQECL